MREQKLVLIVIWLYVASKNMALLYLWTVPKMEGFTLKASRNTNCQQINEITEFEVDSKSKIEDDE